MKDVRSLVVPVLMITVWFGLALGTMVKLARMGGTLADIERAEQARQAQLHAPRLAAAKPCTSAE
jgi:hypothetical protein